MNDIEPDRDPMDQCVRCGHPRWLHGCKNGPHISFGKGGHGEHRDPECDGSGWCEVPVDRQSSVTGYCDCPKFVERGSYDGLVIEIGKLAPDVAQKRRDLDQSIAALQQAESDLRTKIAELAEPVIGAEARLPIRDMNNYLMAVSAALQCKRSKAASEALKKVDAARELLFGK